MYLLNIILLVARELEGKMKKLWLVASIALIWLILLSCGIPVTGMKSTLIPTSGTSAVAAPTNTLPATVPPAAVVDQVTATVPPAATDTVSASPTPCTPNVTANIDTNIRSGPGTNYDSVGALLKGKSATVAGKSEGGFWWFIEFPAGSGSYAWINASPLTAVCIPDNLKTVSAPPTPAPPKKKKKGQ